MPETERARIQLPDGLNDVTLRAFLLERLPAFGSLRGAELIGGGRSNLTYLLHLDAGDVVLRRPPLGHVMPTAHDMAREFRFLSALIGSPVPVPQPLALCEDPALLGQPFYLMSYCPGKVIAGEWPPSYGADADRSRTCDALVRTLVAIHSLDWRATDLAGLARPGNYIERQLKRLTSQYELASPEPLPAVAELRSRLERALPSEQPPVLVHGDFAIHNVVLAEDDPGRVVAVLDWELATIGDPLADLGWMLALWAKGAGSADGVAPEGTFGVTALPGMWTREQVIEGYARVSGRDLRDVEYYYVFGLFKLVVIWAGIDARFRAGATRGEGFEQFAARVPMGAERALAAADASSIPALRG